MAKRLDGVKESLCFIKIVRRKISDKEAKDEERERSEFVRNEWAPVVWHVNHEHTLCQFVSFSVHRR